jgi:adenosine kinase
MTGEELEAGFTGAKVLTGNDYEFGMMAEKLGISESQLRRRVPITVMTRGEAGALLTVEGEEYDIPAAKPLRVVDPTGAGDAFRAGLVKGMVRGFSWPVVGRMAALSAVYAIEQAGTQQHSYTIAEFVERYRENYGTSDEVESLLHEARVTV